jgi:hypothetical protein
MPMYDVAKRAATSGLSGSSRSKRLTTRSYRYESPKYLSRPAVRWFETSVATWISGSEPSCQPAVEKLGTSAVERDQIQSARADP